MAIIKCYECGKEISDKAKACPHCGAPASGATRQGFSSFNTNNAFSAKTGFDGKPKFWGFTEVKVNNEVIKREEFNEESNAENRMMDDEVKKGGEFNESRKRKIYAWIMTMIFILLFYLLFKDVDFGYIWWHGQY